jgi:acetyltransferase-like isoleucine patch superfamily enzyme
MIPLTNPDMFALYDSQDEVPCVHPQAIVEGVKIGAGTRIWAFAHVLPGATIGCDCNIFGHTFIENDVVLGDRVTIKPGVYVWDGTRLEDDVFVGPNVTFTNDRWPRSRRPPTKFDGVTVRRGASIGAGAVIVPGVEIGAYAMIGAGAVVTRNVPAHGLVYGNPARLMGQVCRCGRRLGEGQCPPLCPDCQHASAQADQAA